MGGSLTVNYFAHMNPDVLATYRESERAIVEGRPASRPSPLPRPGFDHLHIPQPIDES
jgi:hypothetical protein